MFLVDRHPLQRGRGLGGIFASLLRKIIPFGKSFAKGALSAGKQFAQSDIGKDIINDTIESTARAATNAILDNDLKGAKNELKKSIKRTRNKSGCKEDSPRKTGESIVRKRKDSQIQKKKDQYHL